MSATVRDVMTTNLAAVRQDAEYKEIVAVLRERRISAVPVLDGDGRVVGVVSEADLLFKQAEADLPKGTSRLAWRLKQKSKAAAVTAHDLMTQPAITIAPDVSLRDAARLMQAHRVKRLPVVDADGQLAGIVSRADMLSIFERPGAEIRDDVVTDIIAGEFGQDPDRFEVTVRSGVVTISGTVAHRAVALRMLAATRHVEGVVAVRDRLSYPAEDYPTGAAKIPTS